MKLADFFARAEIANDNNNYADSLILVYTDSCTVIGPFVGEDAQFEAYDKAIESGLPFTFQTWNRLG